MELTDKDKTENAILAVLVIPRNDRLFDYYINGLSDKRTMLQRKMRQFCADLCPLYSAEIREALAEIRPFIIYPKEQRFVELRENDPPKINRRELLFPMGKLVKEDKIDLSKENESNIKKWAKNYSIWERYHSYLDNEIKKSGTSLYK